MPLWWIEGWSLYAALPRGVLWGERRESEHGFGRQESHLSRPPDAATGHSSVITHTSEHAATCTAPTERRPRHGGAERAVRAAVSAVSPGELRR